MLSLQDFSLVKTKVNRIKNDFSFEKSSDAFYVLAIGREADLQDDELIDTITDNSFLRSKGEPGGHDRGIDAIYIDYDKSNPIVHLFNCKYTEKFEASRDGNFPSNEIDKICGYFRAVMNKDTETLADSNTALNEKTEEIWTLFDEYNPEFYIHLCSNLSGKLQSDERKRLERELSHYSNISIFEHDIYDYVTSINGLNHIYVDAKFRANGKEMFEKSDGDIRALIVNIRADELVRMITDNKELRTNIDLEDYNILKQQEILEDIFYDNVRVYKKQKSRINKSIVETAKSTEKNKFFYYNNGITITCKSFEYSKIAQPVITLTELQIVNGSQTLHALFEVSKEDPNYLKEIEILCRIYELKNSLYSSHIAEYTNSQNPVTTRDIRSIDFIQQKLESEFLAMDYYYERKKNQYESQNNKRRIDSEKAGQAMMAFYNNMPKEARNDKSLMFGDKYETVFNEDINASKVLLAFNLYKEIENKRRAIRKEISLDQKAYEEKAFILYSTYYILYIIGVITQKLEKSTNLSTNKLIDRYYEIAILLIEKAILQEKRNNPGKYSNADFFKSARPKTYIDDYFRRIGKDITKERINSLKMIEIK